jgi:anti-sigma regulatory factor (Ser/Thr protein kinase)
MASLLEEVLKRKEDVEQLELDGMLQSYRFETDSSQELVDTYFSRASEFLTNKLIGKLECFYIETDSSDQDKWYKFGDKLFVPAMLRLGYSEDETYNFNFCMTESYVNAIIHGNKAGLSVEDLLVGKELTEGQIANQSKKVVIEAVVSDNFYMIRVTDEGIGFKGKKKYHKVEEEDVLKSTGRGRVCLREFLDHMYFTKLDDGFQLTIIKYKE